MEHRIRLINTAFDIKICKYRNHGSGILICSGFGIGLAMMDAFESIKFFIDIDNYRHDPIDWECVSASLSMSHIEFFVLAGWYTIDKPVIVNKIKNGIINIPFFEYVGGRDNLLDFIHNTSREIVKIQSASNG